MEHLRIFRIREEYIKLLNGVDKRVQFNKGERRPYVGVVLRIHDIQYFVPMESPKLNHKNIKAGIHIMKLKGGEYGLLGFNNMVPVRESNLITFDIDSEPNAKYRELLKNQLRICNDNKDKIIEHAQKTYRKVVEGKDSFFIKISCDFTLLEKYY